MLLFTVVHWPYVAIHTEKCIYCGTLCVIRTVYLRMVPYVGTYTEKCINCGLSTFTAKHNKSHTSANTVVWCTVWLNLKVKQRERTLCIIIHCILHFTVSYISHFIKFHCILHFRKVVSLHPLHSGDGCV